MIITRKWNHILGSTFIHTTKADGYKTKIDTRFPEKRKFEILMLRSDQYRDIKKNNQQRLK